MADIGTRYLQPNLTQLLYYGVCEWWWVRDCAGICGEESMELGSSARAGIMRIVLFVKRVLLIRRDV